MITLTHDEAVEIDHTSILTKFRQFDFTEIVFIDGRRLCVDETPEQIDEMIAALRKF